MHSLARPTKSPNTALQTNTRVAKLGITIRFPVHSLSYDLCNTF